MSTFLKYLISLAFHTAWMGAGKSGPVPPIRLPKGKSVPLPVIGPWQLLLFTWALRKLWQRYGDDVRAKVGRVDHRVAERIHDWLPSTKPGKSGGRSKSAPPTTFVIPGIPAAAPAGGPAATTAKTQRMPSQTPGGPPSGSLLSRLRKGA
jgi:hypothetical protein